MNDEDEPITRGEWSRAMRDLNAQVQEVVREAVRAQSAANNPPARAVDSDLRREAEELRRELRERDRRELDEMRAELRSLREDQPDPLEQIGQARDLVAALGPEPDSQLMQGLGLFSNVAEAYLAKREEAKQSSSAPTPHDAEPGAAEYGGPEEPHHPTVDSGPGSGPAPAFDLQVLEESG